jgi:hypothetical protein
MSLYAIGSDGTLYTPGAPRRFEGFVSCRKGFVACGIHVDFQHGNFIKATVSYFVDSQHMCMLQVSTRTKGSDNESSSSDSSLYFFCTASSVFVDPSPFLCRSFSSVFCSALNSCTVNAFCGCEIAGLLRKFLKFPDSILDREPLVASGMELVLWAILICVRKPSGVRMC